MMHTQSRTGIRRRPGMGVGTISLLVIFTVLCFSTLALLSLSSAANYRRISRPSQIAAQNLAAAEGVAAEKIADLDAVLAEVQARVLAGLPDGTDEAALPPQEDADVSISQAEQPDEETLQTKDLQYFRMVALRARDMGFETYNNGQLLRFSCPVDESHTLVTEVELMPVESAERYRITKQASIMTGEWEPGEGTGHLWGG